MIALVICLGLVAALLMAYYLGWRVGMAQREIELILEEPPIAGEEQKEMEARLKKLASERYRDVEIKPL